MNFLSFNISFYFKDSLVLCFLEVWSLEGRKGYKFIRGWI